jgi:hypothetical protein
MKKTMLSAVCALGLASGVQAGVLICNITDHGQGFVPSKGFLEIDEAKGTVRYADDFTINLLKKAIDIKPKISPTAVRLKWKITVPTRNSGDLPISYSGMYHKGRKDFRITGSGDLDNRIQGTGPCKPYKGKWYKK